MIMTAANLHRMRRIRLRSARLCQRCPRLLLYFVSHCRRVIASFICAIASVVCLYSGDEPEYQRFMTALSAFVTSIRLSISQLRRLSSMNLITPFSGISPRYFSHTRRCFSSHLLGSATFTRIYPSSVSVSSPTRAVLPGRFPF